MKKSYSIIFMLTFLFCVVTAGLQNTALAQIENNTQTLKTIVDKGVPNANQFLYIIDGMRRSKEDLDLVSPSNIESITILKDAKAMALYGSEGKNGVLLITLREKLVIKETSINVFPNPTSEFVNITLDVKEKSEVEIKIYNLQTLESYEVVKEEYEVGEQTIKYQTNFLKNGIYTLKIKVGNQIIERKLVIEN